MAWRSAGLCVWSFICAWVLQAHGNAHGGNIQVVANRETFVVVDMLTGVGNCWGGDFGNVGIQMDCSHVNFHDMEHVYANDYAFVGVNLRLGFGRCWGNPTFPSYGANCGGVDFNGVTDVFANSYAFLALNRNAGIGECWGAAELGGDCSTVNFDGVTHVYSIDSAFLAVNHDAGLGQCWGRLSDVGRHACSYDWGAMSPRGNIPTPRDIPLVVYDHASGTVLLFGGESEDGRQIDLYSYDTAADRYTRVRPAGGAPSDNADHAAAFDPVRRRMMVLNKYEFNRTWHDSLIAYDVEGNFWTELKPTGQIPPVMESATATIENRTLYTFGGKGRLEMRSPAWGEPEVQFLERDYLNNELHAYDIEADHWTLITPSWGAGPEPRYQHTAVLDPLERRILIFGGTNETDYLNDLHAYDIQNNSWIALATTGPRPFSRTMHCAVFDPIGRRMLIWGGLNATNNAYLNDIWQYDVEADNWAELTPSGPPPPARAANAAVWDARLKKMLIFGGHDIMAMFDDIWEFDPYDKVSFEGVDKIYTNSRAFVALNENRGTGQCWGSESSRDHDDYGGDCAHIDFHGVTDIFSTDGAFLALVPHAGEGYCWGDPRLGGDCSHVNFEGVASVHPLRGEISGRGAFLVLHEDGAGQCWGDAAFGGDCSGVDFTGVTEVYATDGAFLAFNRAGGTGVCWGNAEFGGNCSAIDFSGVTNIHPNNFAFVALNNNTFEAKCWGPTLLGGNCSLVDFAGTTHVHATGQAFLTLNDQIGRARCWGEPRTGGECNFLASWTTSTKTTTTTTTPTTTTTTTSSTTIWTTRGDGPIDNSAPCPPGGYCPITSTTTSRTTTTTVPTTTTSSTATVTTTTFVPYRIPTSSSWHVTPSRWSVGAAATALCLRLLAP